MFNRGPGYLRSRPSSVVPDPATNASQYASMMQHPPTQRQPCGVHTPFRVTVVYVSSLRDSQTMLSCGKCGYLECLFRGTHPEYPAMFLHPLIHDDDVEGNQK